MHERFEISIDSSAAFVELAANPTQDGTGTVVDFSSGQYLTAYRGKHSAEIWNSSGDCRQLRVPAFDFKVAELSAGIHADGNKAGRSRLGQTGG